MDRGGGPPPTGRQGSGGPSGAKRRRVPGPCVAAKGLFRAPGSLSARDRTPPQCAWSRCMGPLPKGRTRRDLKGRNAEECTTRRDMYRSPPKREEEETVAGLNCKKRGRRSTDPIRRNCEFSRCFFWHEKSFLENEGTRMNSGVMGVFSGQARQGI